ncbi:NACHT domain-containing protein [Kutzneria sp. NPDC052558]|uniref:NACHT domain-containing protein n=1 Tax=Kutzneria sp. NPDC052558 TaxID=3364121 RepID=UPI0037CAFEDB
MDVAITPTIARTAGGAVAKVLGGLAPELLREVRRKRKVRRSIQALLERPATGLDQPAERLAPVEVSRLVAYVRLPDFEQVAIALTGLVLEHKQPDKYVADLRSGLTRSLRLHGVVSGPDVDAIATALFDELWSAVVLTVGQAGDPTHVAAIPGMAVTVSMRAAAAARNCQLLERLRTIDDTQAFVRALRSQIGRVEGFVRLQHTESGRRVPLASIYVEPQLEKHSAEAMVKEPERIASKDVLTRCLRAVVLGEPGCGKSTLAAMITCRIARATEARLRGTVPFLVVMRDYAGFVEREQLSVARYLQAMVGARYQIEPPPDCVEYLLLNGCGVVIFDGLDELLDTSLRRKIVEAVEAFAYAYPTATVVVTSRLVGYEQAPLDSALFAHLRLADFDDAQVEDYAGKWFGLDRDLSQPKRRELAKAFVLESAYAPDLRRNALMLSLMCALYRGEGYIPRNRLDLYERCSVLLFERWDRQRGIEVSLPFQQHVRPVLWFLAEWMFTNGNTKPAVTQWELTAAAQRFLLRKRFEDSDEAEAAATAFVEYCRGRAWVLTEVGTTSDGEPLFAFTHRTFLEFFTANQLVRTHPGARNLLDVLLPHIRNEEWDVVTELAVLLLDRHIDDGADDFLELLLRDADARPLDDRVPILTFAAKLLSSFVPTPRLRHRVFDACWELASSMDGDAARVDPTPWRRKSPLGWLLVASPENRGPIATMIAEHARAENPAGISAALAVALDQLLLGIPPTLWRSLRDFWYGESVTNAVTLRPVFRKLASKRAWAAVEAVFGGDLSIVEAIELHGAAAVCEGSPLWGTSYRRAPIIQQQVLLDHDLEWRPEFPWVVDPLAGTWAEELAATLTAAPTPWVRLSRLPWWDMDVEDAPNTTPTGTAAFDTMVLCACLLWEARAAARDRLPSELGPEPLPSWLRQPPTHPLSVLMTNAGEVRYGGKTALLTDAAREWLSPVVHAFVSRWAAGGIDLVLVDAATIY